MTVVLPWLRILFKLLPLPHIAAQAGAMLGLCASHHEPELLHWEIVFRCRTSLNLSTALSFPVGGVGSSAQHS